MEHIDFWVYEVACIRREGTPLPEFCDEELIQGICDSEKCAYFTTIIPDCECSVLIEDQV